MHHSGYVHHACTDSNAIAYDVDRYHGSVFDAMRFARHASAGIINGLAFDAMRCGSAAGHAITVQCPTPEPYGIGHDLPDVYGVLGMPCVHPRRLETRPPCIGCQRAHARISWHHT